MNKQTLYTYLGTNGTLTTPIHLEGIYSVKKIILTADEGKMLTKDFEHFYKKVTTTDLEFELWQEVISSGQK